MTPKCTRRPRQIVACTKGKCSRLSRRPRRSYHGLKLRGAPMETKAPSPQTIRFGDFELDARAGELRKKDLHILLGERRLRVIRDLDEHRGKVVTRAA